MSGTRELNRLMCSMFVGGGLHAFLRDELGCDVMLLAALPGPQTPLLDLVSELLVQLTSRGELDEELFHALLRSRPGRAAEIAEAFEPIFGRPMSWVPDAIATRDFDWAALKPVMAPCLVRLLQDAAKLTVGDGFDELSTTAVFQAYGLHQPWVRRVLPLPPLTGDAPDPRVDLWTVGPRPSRCVRISMLAFAGNLKPPEQATSHDLFFDLARYGAGKSVRIGLRGTPQGTIAGINALAHELGVGLRSRHGAVGPGA